MSQRAPPYVKIYKLIVLGFFRESNAVFEEFCVFSPGVGFLMTEK